MNTLKESINKSSAIALNLGKLISEAKSAVKLLEEKRQTGLKISNDLLDEVISEFTRLEIISKTFLEVSDDPLKKLMLLLTYLFKNELKNTENWFFDGSLEWHIQIWTLLQRWYNLTNYRLTSDIIDQTRSFVWQVENAQFSWFEEYLFFWLENEFEEIIRTSEYWKIEVEKMKKFLNFLLQEDLITKNEHISYLEWLSNDFRKYNCIKDLILLWYFDEEEKLLSRLKLLLSQYYEEIKDYTINPNELNEALKNQTLDILEIIDDGSVTEEQNLIEDFWNLLLRQGIINEESMIWFHQDCFSTKNVESLEFTLLEYSHDWVYSVISQSIFDVEKTKEISKKLINYYNSRKETQRVKDIELLVEHLN